MVAKIKSSLFLQVILALILGLIVGCSIPNTSSSFKTAWEIYLYDLYNY